MRWSARRERFRTLIEGDRCVHPGSVFDPISARIAEDLGFEVGMFAGSVASMTVLGAPDLIVLTLPEFAGQAHRICRAGDLALLVDADHGYGNALNVRRTVEELENAGVVALSIEDTELLTSFGAAGKPRLLSMEEGVGKVRAACDARRDARLVIAGRTSAAAVTDIEDCIARAKAYEAAGADMIFLVGVSSRDDLDAIVPEIGVPIVLGGTGPGLSDLDALAERGVRVALQTHKPFFAAIHAVHDTLKALREGTPADEIDAVASPELMRQVTRSEDYDRWIRDYLGG